MTEKRDMLDILQTLMEAFGVGSSKTAAMQNAMISYGQLMKYLTLLLQRDLIYADQEDGRVQYRLTVRGKQFLDCLRLPDRQLLKETERK